ncbi:PREDICTED: uncharacterized protein LOC104784499 [Camelina sativa]|uniref:Uncharacterized protein LOC104784499 n=1 Tax=Camelina sativa TaxID=90675 RepID=A0ABM0YY92_CAMSA|nr:PREDICTED: uncharacterized protein LOC104784499 [Camelina sativa]
MVQIGSETSTDYCDIHDGWQVMVTKRYYNQGLVNFVARKIDPNESLANNKNAFRVLMTLDEETEKPILSFSEAAAKIDPSHLAAFLVHEKDLWRFYFYLEKAFSQVSLPWVKMLKELPLSKLLIHLSLCHIPISVYDTLADWIKQPKIYEHLNFVTWALDRILTDWESAQQGLDSKAVAKFVELALLLRCSNPNIVTTVLRMLRVRPRYQGQDTLPVLVWMLAQATHGDFSAGLYSWAHVLLPLVGSYKRRRPRSIDLILQFVEIILSNTEAQTILVNRAVWEEERLIPPSSFETLLRLTFPASSARVKSTKRFEAIYPLLKEVALAPETATGGKAVEQIFTFSLKLAGEGVVVTGNPGLAKEAAAIAIRSVTEHVDCFNHWDILYEDYLEASVALLRKLADEWKDHSPKLLSSPGDTLAVNRAMSSFRLQNEKGITEGGANCSLYNEADKSCKLILGRLSRESGRFNIAPITAVVLAAAGSVAGAALALYAYH